ncbi:hypothetical protein HYDPIDRAFT_113820 [Hydnomerulius pinastri MD-312]|uniref:Transmembrane protein n=1 Tax=Hydnomerulius pinastri MD-312 TaxID=994086 RepID=A0A0C9VC81_9AGAM|nr:hypothetical protein HYDPIDRAFT_113820 [Hydnomerulius pinastri MD-312]
MWWEDAWAGLALLADALCLVCTLLEQPLPNADVPRVFYISNWILSFAFPAVLWAARISILISIVRVSQPSPRSKRVATLIGVSFGLMWLVLSIQKLEICLHNSCMIGHSVAIAQIITDSIADILLVALPIRFLRNVKLSRKRRILISSAFSATILITVVTILHSVVLFGPSSTGTIIIGHVKAAVSLIVCNLLVIVTFVYRVLHRDEVDLDDSIIETSQIEFTTVDLNNVGFNSEGSRKGGTLSVPSATTGSSNQVSSGRSKGNDRSKLSSMSAVSTSGGSV